MTGSLQQAIADANSRTAGARRQQFGKRATDQQHHTNLLSNVEVLMEALRGDVAAGMVVSKNLREAMREMGAAITLSKRKLQS